MSDEETISMTHKKGAGVKVLLSAVIALTAVAGQLPASAVSQLTAHAADSSELSEKGFAYSVNSDGTVTVTSCDWSLEGDVIIPEKLGGKLVSCVANGAFNSRTHITKLTVPANVTLERFAFGYMTGLKELVLGDGCKSLGYIVYYTADWKPSLETVVLGKNCSICANTFRGAYTVNTVRAGDGTVIDAGAFPDGDPQYMNFDGTVVYSGRTYVDYNNEKPAETTGEVMPQGSYVAASVNSVPCSEEYAVEMNTFGRPSGRKYSDSGEYTKSGLADGGYWTPDTLQVLTDNKGNKYAAYGYFSDQNDFTAYNSYNLTDYIGWCVLKPEDGSKSDLVIRKDSWSFGAATIDENNYLYILWGRLLTDSELSTASDNHVKNLVLEKYDMNGKLVGSHEFDCNTSTGTDSRYPFDAGNAQIAINKGVICITYNTEWHSGHQGLVNYMLKQSDLSAAEVMRRTNVGSHSFGHSLIKTSDGFALVQTGDCYPRSLNVVSYKVNSTTSFTTTNLKKDWFHCAGNYATTAGTQGDNNPTYANFGSIAENSNTYALSGYGTREYIPTYFKDRSADATYDAFIQIKSKKSETKGVGTVRKNSDTGETVDTDIIWLTDTKGTDILPGVSKLVTLDDGSYCALWEEFENGQFDDLYFEIFDENGNVITDKTPIKGARLPDNTVQPVADGTKLTWACADKKDNEIDWYTVDVSDLSSNVVDNASISLDGDIGVNFYFKPSAKAATAVLEGPNDPVSFDISRLSPQSNGEYMVSYAVKNTQLKDTVSLKIYDANGVQLDLFNICGDKFEDGAVSYSVKKYIDFIDNSGTASAKLRELVDSLYSYGSHSAHVLLEKPMPTGTELPTKYASLTGDDLADYEVQFSGSNLPKGIKLTNMTLTVYSKTSFRLYFTADSISGTEFKINGTKTEPINCGGKTYMLELPDICAYDLTKAFTMSIGNSNIRLSPLSYAKTMLDNDSFTADEKNIAKALCRYSTAAKAYFNK